MKYKLIIGFVFCTSFTLCANDFVDKSFSQVLGDASKIVRFKLKTDFTKKIDQQYFDFKRLLVVEKDSENVALKCDLFYNGDELTEASYIVGSSIYRVFFYHSDDFVFYNVYISSLEADIEIVDFAPGFFVYDKNTSRTIFIGFIIESLASLTLNLTLDRNDVNWGFESTGQVELRSINRIIEVDISLKPVSSITLKESNLLTYSKHAISEKELIEEVHVYSSQDCEEPTSLSKMSLEDVFTHLEEGLCNPTLIFKSHPKLNKVDFLWANMFWEYD